MIHPAKLRCKACRHKRALDRRALTERRCRLLAHFGITLDDYNSLLASQGGACAICRSNTPVGRSRRYFAVDHCHVTGRIRGLLCTTCNAGLGMLGDSIEGLQRALNYLTSGGLPPPLANLPFAAHGRSLTPHRITSTRYIGPDGRRATKSTPGARRVDTQGKTFFVRFKSRQYSLKTTDEAEANRLVEALKKQPLGQPSI
jgi:hypothetical protein